MAENVVKTKNKVIDVVSGKEVNPETAEYSANYKGKVYYFDSAENKSAFLEDPEQYAPAG
jgi:YHS domain-containing protein